MFYRMGEFLARSQILGEVVRMGRMTALQKPAGGVRGIVAGDMVRRLVAQTMPQHIRILAEKATEEFQHSFSTWAGCECTAHAVQASTDADPRATVFSVDGISAYDSISRVAMMRGLRLMHGGDAFHHFVRQFYGSCEDAA